MKKKFDEETQLAVDYILDIVENGDRASRAELICKLICSEKFDLIDELQARWGDKKFYEIVEYC